MFTDHNPKSRIQPQQCSIETLHRMTATFLCLFITHINSLIPNLWLRSFEKPFPKHFFSSGTQPQQASQQCPVLPKRCNVSTSPMAAQLSSWKLCCHWLKGLWQYKKTLVRQDLEQLVTRNISTYTSTVAAKLQVGNCVTKSCLTNKTKNKKNLIQI